MPLPRTIGSGIALMGKPKKLVIGGSLLNGDFEATDAGSPDPFVTWVGFVSGTTAITAGTGRDGSGNCCRVTVDATNGAGSIDNDNVLTVGKRYEFAVWARQTNGAANNTFYMSDTGSVVFAFTASTAWQLFKGSFLATATDFRLNRAAANQILEYDDVYLYEL